MSQAGSPIFTAAEIVIPVRVETGQAEETLRALRELASMPLGSGGAPGLGGSASDGGAGPASALGGPPPSFFPERGEVAGLSPDVLDRAIGQSEDRVILRELLDQVSRLTDAIELLNETLAQTGGAP